MFQYPLGGSWGCNLRVVSETQPRFCFSILWVDRGGETPSPVCLFPPPGRFSILWVDRGGETRAWRVLRGGDGLVSVSSGWIVGVKQRIPFHGMTCAGVSVSSGWIVGVKQNLASLLRPFTVRFSILWVDRGGETRALEAAVYDLKGFSIIWVDRGGETPVGSPVYYYPVAFQYPLGGSWG